MKFKILRTASPNKVLLRIDPLRQIVLCRRQPTAKSNRASRLYCATWFTSLLLDATLGLDEHDTQVWD